MVTIQISIGMITVVYPLNTSGLKKRIIQKKHKISDSPLLEAKRRKIEAKRRKTETKRRKFEG